MRGEWEASPDGPGLPVCGLDVFMFRVPKDVEFYCVANASSQPVGLLGICLVGLTAQERRDVQQFVVGLRGDRQLVGRHTTQRALIRFGCR